MRKSPGTAKARAKNFFTGEFIGVMVAAATRWAAYRARHTRELKRRAGGALIQAFVDTTPSDDQFMARARMVTNVDEKVKHLSTHYIATNAPMKGTGMSTACKEDHSIKFGGAVIFRLIARGFKKLQV